MSKITWIPVKYELPKDSDRYLVWVHEPVKTDPWVLDENGNRIDLSFSTIAYFNKEQGGIWIARDLDEVYGSNLSNVDVDSCYYISHWSPLPDGPKEE